MSESGGQLEERRGVLGWLVRHPKITIALILFLMVELTLLALQRGAENALARRIGAIRAKGEPTCVADLLARQRHIPDEDNIVMALVRPSEKMVKAETTDDDKQLHYLGFAKRRPTGERWSDGELAAARHYLQRFAPEIASIHAGLRLREGVLNIRWSNPAINTPIPELSYLRHVSKLLSLEAMTTGQDGDRERTEQLLIEARPLQSVLNEDSALIGALVQIAITAVALDRIERSINLIGLSDKSLQSADEWLRSIENLPDMAAAARIERAAFLDTQKWLYSASWRGYVPLLPKKDITEAVGLQNLCIDAASAPYAELKARFAAIDAKANSLPQYFTMSYTMVPMMIPSYSRALVLSTRAIGENRALRAVIAAERSRLATGKWPASLAQLVPGYLAAVPADPIDGKPIRYATIPEGIKTWTIAGDDHDEDNGGDVRRLEPYNEKIKPKDSGWVILNPELRGRAAPAEAATTRGSTGG